MPANRVSRAAPEAWKQRCAGQIQDWDKTEIFFAHLPKNKEQAK
jgi:hypothetical protein